MAYLKQIFTAVDDAVYEGFMLLMGVLDPIPMYKWPRNISTHATQNKQIWVYSAREALKYFKAADYLDCRISAYSYVAGHEQIDTLHLDHDLEHFKSLLALNKAHNRTRDLLHERFGQPVRPMILWSGNGYADILPVQGYRLEDKSIYGRYFKDVNDNPSREFLRWSEQYLTDGKADICHSKSISFNNMMLRVPNSFNSSNGERVRIVQYWDGNRPDIKPLLVDFYVHCVDKQVKQRRLDKETKKRLAENKRSGHYNNGIILWIEALIENGPALANHRKYVIWRILAPYLINIKKLSYEQAFDVLTYWLARCAKAKKLDFNAEQRIRDSLRTVCTAKAAYLPISVDKLQQEKPDLWGLLQS